MGVVDGALVGAERPSLGQRGDPVHAGKQPERVLPTLAGGSLTVGFAGVADGLDAAVALPGVGDDCGAWGDMAGDERVRPEAPAPRRR